MRANGLDIHYRISGEGAETVVLVNGVGDDLEAWAMQVAPLAAAGLRVITFDNRGVGRTSLPPGPYSSREMAADTKALTDALGLTPFHLVGVSLGGLIAQEYALSYPDDLRSVVLANTYARPDAYTRAAFDAWGQVAEAGGMALMMRQQAPWVFSPAFFEAQPERLATIIIIRLSLSHRLFEELPRGSWTVVPGGHAAFVENPDPWNRAVIEFIDRHRATVH